MMRLSRVVAAAFAAFFVFASVERLPAQSLPVLNGLEVWLDATDASTLYTDGLLQTPIDPANVGGPIGGWRDKSPNGYEVFQFDEVMQPSYHDSAMNGQPAVRFTGADADGMEFFPATEITRPYTAFIVNQYWGDTRGRTLQSRDINWLLGLWNGNVGHYAAGWVSAAGGSLPATLNTPYAVDTVGTETSSSFFLNGEEFTFDSTPVGSPFDLGFSSVGSFPAEVSDADVSEVIIYNRALDQVELDSVRAYLYDKYDTVPYEPPPPILPVIHAGQVGTFTGADAGEGLDFSGEFVYALNVGGPGLTALGDPLTVGDAVFTDASEAGLVGVFDVTITDANEILNWHAPAYGDSPDDDNLELAMQSIRWNVPPGVDISLNVQEGEYYQLQLLFAESCCNRGFDIFIEGEEVVEDLVVQVLQDGINNTSMGVVYTHTIQATDSILDILLGGSAPVPDNNPILNALTLERVDAPLPMGIPGDYNGNGTVEQADLDLVLLNWGASFDALPPEWVNERPGEGIVAQAQLDGVLLNWGNMAPLAAAGVPEPSTLLLAALIGLAGLFWRSARA